MTKQYNKTKAAIGTAWSAEEEVCSEPSSGREQAGSGMPQSQRGAVADASEAVVQYENNHNDNHNSCDSNSNNNKWNKSDHLTLESDQESRQTFNDEPRVVGVACNAPPVAVPRTRRRNTNACSVVKSNNTPPNGHAYENLKFDLDLNKRLLLHRYFRSTASACGDYENLCRGCGYGVFGARGYLCNFCECIVHGVQPRSGAEPVEQRDASATIYENVCGKCTRIYGGEVCDCAAPPIEAVIDDSDLKLSVISADSGKASAARDRERAPAGVEIRPSALPKSKSFGKHGILQSLFGTLRRVRSPQSASTATATAATASSNTSSATSPTTSDTASPGARKRLQIVHNVDGFDKVFRTQETFDLQRICELKRSRTSCSDQHIYGRLKRTEGDGKCEPPQTPVLLSQSHDPLLESTDSLNSARTTNECSRFGKQAATGCGTGKRARISKPRLLRSRSHNCESYGSPADSAPIGGQSHRVPAKQSLYLPDSVCHWMTSLRREVHNYRSLVGPVIAADNADVDDGSALCYPKSIPAKHALVYGASGSGVNNNSGAPVDFVSNCQNIDSWREREKFMLTATACGSSSDTLNGAGDLGTCDEIVNCPSASGASNETVRTQREAKQQFAPVAQMVADFKRNLVARQMQQQQQQRQMAAAGAFQRTAVAAQATARLKRQAIYLKIDDKPNSNNSNECESQNDYSRSGSDNNNERGNNSNDANVNCSNKQTNDSTSLSAAPRSPSASTSHFVEAAAAVSRQGLASRRAAYEPITTSSKRCGIYERDSEFVNDILSAFDTFLQRESHTEIGEPQQESEAYQPTGEQPVAARNSHSKEPINPDPIVILATAAANSSHTQTRLAPPSATCGDSCESALLQPLVAAARSPRGFEHIFDVLQLIKNQLLSLGLNTVVVRYDPPLRAFLLGVYNGGVCKRLNRDRLVGKYRRFYAYCQQQQRRVTHNATAAVATADQSVKLALLSGTLGAASGAHESESVLQRAASKNGSDHRKYGAGGGECVAARESVKIIVKRVKPREVVGDKTHSSALVLAAVPSASQSAERGQVVVPSVEADKKVVDSACDPTATAANVERANKSQVLCKLGRGSRALVQRPPGFIVPKSQVIASPNAQNILENSFKCVSASSVRPQVPARDPKTVLTPSPRNSPPTPPFKRESQTTAVAMTVPTANSSPTHATSGNRNSSVPEEDIYQPIWKFKTVGEVQEHYHTDADYYDIGSDASAAAKSQLTADSSAPPSILISNDVEDHNEWETDDEFMFATQMEYDVLADEYSMNSSTVRSTRSASSGSTVTGFGSSTATLGSAVSASLTHHLLRNVGIFYSPNEPKLRAIIYDYDRVYSSVYFAKQQYESRSQSQVAPSPTPANECRSNDSGIGKSPQERSPIPPPRTTSAAKTKGNPPATGESGCQATKAEASVAAAASAKTPPKLLPDSVQAWKFMLLDVNYIEDEEDLIVSETEVLRAQEIKEDVDTRQTHETHQLNILQRFKSASFGNLIDLPNEDDKKSIAERMRNKLQRGVFRLNVRSPKSEKKSRGFFRRAEASSLYLEDGVKPKYPIFGVPLDELELNQSTHPNVPRFVVDCVEYIERRDCIDQDGLYRASGNKVAIDELKAKLCETYFYDPKLLVTNDIHTLTSLLKQFFRELGAPLVPQETYERLGANLSDVAALETMRQAFEEMREPNRSTLKFLIRHLTNVAAHSADNRMPASNLAIVWGPCILSVIQIEFDIGRMNTFAKVLIENYARIFNENERLVA